MMRTPGFWYTPPGALSAALTPLSWLWRAGAALRGGAGWSASVPVLCVGNLVAGGTGKTPVVRDLVERLRLRGISAASLSRGHGGRLRGPVAVDPLRHGAGDVGDEPLLLARHNPAWIGRDRVCAARTMVAAGTQVIIMDDGFQNPTLVKDMSLLVVDGATGFGNGRLIPAGPLREPLGPGLARADAIVVIGSGPGVAAVRAVSTQIPVLTATMVPDPAVVEGLRDRPVLAFAGIGRPEKFFTTLRDAGAVVTEAVGFADHHPYSLAELTALAMRAENRGAMLVTTEKDAMRLPADWQQRVTILPVRLCFDDEAAVEGLLDQLMGGRHG